MNALLSTTYFGPVQWYQKLHRSEVVYLEQHENFIKQTYRNRCVIATTNGLQVLTVPVEHAEGNNGLDSRNIASLHISDHNNWRRVHWNALMTAYGESPFFDYYADDLRPFFERKWETLFEFNLDITRKMCELLDIHPDIRLTGSYRSTKVVEEENCEALIASLVDYREAIRPKHPLPDNDFSSKPYYQVYAPKQGFFPNLSILDLLFNMGNEAIFYL